MNKVKLVLLIILLVVLADFAYENPLPRLELKLFRFSLGHLPTFLLAYVGLALGLVVGWFGHVLRIRKKRRQTPAQALPPEPPAPKSQPGQEAS